MLDLVWPMNLENLILGQKQSVTIEYGPMSWMIFPLEATQHGRKVFSKVDRFESSSSWHSPPTLITWPESSHLDSETSFLICKKKWTKTISINFQE